MDLFPHTTQTRQHHSNSTSHSVSHIVWSENVWMVTRVLEAQAVLWQSPERARAPNLDSYSWGQSCALCANLQHCRMANSFSKLPVKLQAHPQKRFLRETAGTRSAGRQARPAALLPLPSTGCSSFHPAPALRVLGHGGSPRTPGCTAPACRKFPVCASSTLGDGGKGNEDFFSTPNESSKQEKSILTCFINSAIQEPNWDTSGPPFYSGHVHTDQILQL